MADASPAPQDARPSRTPAFDTRLLAPMIAGAILNPINSSIIAVALVPIGIAFGAPPSQTAWLITALYLATAIGQPVVGKLVDAYGPRALFLPATALVGIAGIVGALAPNLGTLIAARVILGFGTCAGYPSAMRLIRDESERTGRDSPASVLTILAISTQTISVIGPALGGVLIGVGGWRATLAINVPIAVAAFILGWWRLPRRERRPHGAARINLDVPGMTLFSLAVVGLLLALTDADMRTWWMGAGVVAASAGFIWRELTYRAPFIDLRLLAANGPLVRTYVRVLLSYLVMYGFMYGFAPWLQDGRGLAPEVAGLITLPTAATAIAVSALTGRRQAVRTKLLVASAGQILGCGALLLLGDSSAVVALIAVAIVFGIPQGLNSIALQNAVYRQADGASLAAASGLLRTFGYLGAILASAAIGGVYGNGIDASALHSLALVLLAVAVGYLLLTALDRRLR